MPAAVKLAESLPEDLVVLFIESQRSPGAAAEAMAYNNKWMASNTIWTTERPFDVGVRGLPKCALLSREGKVLLVGRPHTIKSRIEEAIAKEKAAAKKAPADLPSSLKQAWSDFRKERYAKAISQAAKVRERGGDDAEAADKTLEHFSKDLESQITRLDWMVSNGYYLEAQERLDSFAKNLKGVEKVEPKVTALASKLAAPELKSELAAAKAFSKIEKKIKLEGFDKPLVKQLEWFIAKKGDTKAAARARHLIELAAVADVK